MANYIASCRTNYFKVKDSEAFIEEMSKVPNIAVTEEAKGFIILGEDPDGAGWPSFGYDDETEEEYEIDLPDLVAEHLADGEVAIFMESGAEKLRYIIGQALAINNKGEYRVIGLDDIYTLAQDLTDRPKDITVAEY